MAYLSEAEGGYGTTASEPITSLVHHDNSHGDFVNVPDAELLFTGDFRHAGPDLVITGHDGRHHLIPDYFAGETSPALMAPNGASLSSDLVNLLAGSRTPGQYAQTQPATSPDSIGKVEKVIGNVTVMRNGVSVALHVGDNVFKSDVIQTAANSACGIGFPDGTALSLVANTRMALNDYSYDPNGTSNSALFSLVDGTFAFVAGKVAHTGDMKVATPVATMGIRGTTGLVHKEIATINANVGQVTYSFVVVEDYGTHRVGRYEVIDEDPNSPTYGQVIAVVNDSGYVTYVTPQGRDLPPIVTTQPITNLQLAVEHQIINDLFQILNNNPNPQSTPGSTGSGDNPDQLFPPPQLFQENGGQPFAINFLPFGAPVNAFAGQPNFGVRPLPPLLPHTGLPLPNPGPPLPLPNSGPPPFVPPSSNIFIWNSGNGSWDTPSGWNVDAVPKAPADVVEILSGAVTFNDAYIIDSLYIAPAADLAIDSGSLTVLGAVDDGGTLRVDGDPPALTIDGPLTVERTGKLVVVGTGDTVDVVGDAFNFGTIAAMHGGVASFDGAALTNEVVGRIVSRGSGSAIEFTNETINNFAAIITTHRGEITFDVSGISNEIGGVIEAKHRGVVTFDNTDVINEFGAVIAAVGRRSQIISSDNFIDNSGTISATNHGTVSLQTVRVINQAGGEFEAADRGKIMFDQSELTNDGMVEALGSNSLIVLKNDDTFNSGIIGAGHGGTIEFKGESVTNEAAGTSSHMILPAGEIVATDYGAVDFDSGSSVTNETGALIEAKDHGSISIHSASVYNQNEAIIEAGHRGSIWIDDSVFDNEKGGTVEAKAFGTVSLADTSIDNETNAEIEAIGRDARVAVAGGGVSNAGTFLAVDRGAVFFDGLNVANQQHATIEAKDHGTVTFDSVFLTNAPGGGNGGAAGMIEARDHGTIWIKDSAVGNAGTIEALDVSSAVIFSCDRVSNTGLIVAKYDGAARFSNSNVLNHGTGTIEAAECGTVGFRDTSVTNTHGGTIEAADYGSVVFDGGSVTNEHDSTIKATDRGTIAFKDTEVANKHDSIIQATDRGTVLFDDAVVANTGDSRIEALHHGTVAFDNTDATNSDGAMIWATRGGTVTFDHSHIDNDGGTIAAYGAGSVVDLSNTTIYGGTLATGDPFGGGCGVIDIVAPRHGSTNTTVFNGVDSVLKIDGYVDVAAGAALELTGTIRNDGTINLDPIAAVASELVIGGRVTLDGNGQVTLSGADEIIGAAGLHSADVLDNFDYISGAGEIGGGSSALTLNNSNTIDADLRGETLTIDTGGHTIHNDGTLEASCGGLLKIDSAVDNICGEIVANAGSTVDIAKLVVGGAATIAGGTLTYAAALGVDTSFTGNTPGELVLDGTGLAFIGDKVSGFSSGDAIDLGGIGFSHATTLTYFDSFLTVSDGFFGPSVTIQLEGNYDASDFILSKDGSGTKILYDAPPTITGAETIDDSPSATPLSHFSDDVSGTVTGSISFEDASADNSYSTSFTPASNHDFGTFSLGAVSEDEAGGSVEWSFNFDNVKLSSGETLTQSYDVKIADQNGAAATQEISVSIGGPGNDNFVFQPGIGADTIINFNPQADTIELDHFANLHSMQQLAALITTDAHGDAVIELGHNDSITIPGMTGGYLQAHLQSLVHLHA